ncbi:MAG TPA: squalene synthase HpnC [Candidatus Udaeobacter sp.]|nr:squalene synthase HpnC [Candidatus Udaeobacter sp.]
MTTASEASSGKTHRDENFPVASWLIHPRHRPAILAFYRFVRAADDVADHATLAPAAKLALLDRLEATLTGQSDGEPAGVALREALAARGLAPRHVQDLLTAFRMDVTKLSYADWDDLMGYCRYSAMPVGRFVLDVHGEPHSTWVASDALCAALQVINHLQDCAADYRNLHRVYIPRDALAAGDSTPGELGLPAASAGLLSAIRGLARRTDDLLRQAAPLPIQVGDTRLALECAVIIRLARKLNAWLQKRDPLRQRVHLRPVGIVGLTLFGLLEGALGRRGRGRS